MKIVFLLLLPLIFLPSCQKSKPPEKPAFAASPSSSSLTKRISKIQVTYQLLSGKSPLLSWLHKGVSEDTLNILLALNRVSERHLFRLDSLIVPDTFLSDLKDYAPFPRALDSVRDVKKIIFISNSIQAFGAYENGALIRWGPVSLGKVSTPTKNGLYYTNWKSKRAVSTIDEAWIMNWYFNLDNFKGVSLHEYDLPGFPASHSCARMLEKDAKWIYYWADQWILSSNSRIAGYGTPVIIYGSYPYAAEKPLRQIKHITGETTIAEIKTEIETFHSLILKRQTERTSLLE